MRNSDSRNGLVSILLLVFIIPSLTLACSTFKLPDKSRIVYGHNLNQGDIGVPGLLFINPRGLFKKGRTWTELTTKEESNPSSQYWISRYGSVTFNCFGRDLPDGGINEAGLVVWEMSDDVEYPVNDSLPKLCQMNWIQYILDNFSTTKEAIQCAYDFQIDGWGWHFFIGDAEGSTAVVSFKDGQVIINKDEEMPFPALFNEPYSRELELLQYYQGHGGQYPIDVHNPKTPRFVRYTKLADEFNPKDDIIKYGFKMLQTLRVNDDPEWSVLFDIDTNKVYFRTRKNPAIKHLSLAEIDFSNQNPVKIVNIDMAKGGNISSRLDPYSNSKMSNFTRTHLFPLLPDNFFTQGGLSKKEYLDRTSNHSDIAGFSENQYFKGSWEYQKENGETITYIFQTRENAVSGKIVMSETDEVFSVDHLHLIGNKIKFTYLKSDGRLIEVKGLIEKDTLQVSLAGIENYYGTYKFNKKSSR